MLHISFALSVQHTPTNYYLIDYSLPHFLPYQLNCVTCALSLLSSFAFSILKVAVLSAAAAAVDVAVYNPNSNELL